MKYFTAVSTVVLLLATWGIVQGTPIRSNEIMKHAQDLLVGLTGDEDSFSWKEAVDSVFGGKKKMNCNAIQKEHKCKKDPECSWCSGDWFDECFIQEVAKKLPTKHFTCTNMPDLEDDVTIQEEVLMTVAEDNVDKKGPKGPKCKDMKTAATCEDTECSWCTSPFIPIGICVNSTAENWMPKPFFDCSAKGDAESDGSEVVSIKEEVLMTISEGDEVKPKGPKCKDMKTAATCEDTECSWCTSPFIPIGICVNSTAENWMPKPFFDCSAKGDAESDGSEVVSIKEEMLMTISGGDEVKPKGPKCKDMKTAATCEDTECSWCTSPFIPIGICVNSTAENWMPKPFFECSGQKEEDSVQFDWLKDVLLVEEDSLEKKKHINKTLAKMCKKHKSFDECSADDECSWCNGGKKGKWFAKCFSNEESVTLSKKHFKCNVTAAPEETLFTMTEVHEEKIKVQGDALSIIEDFFEEEVMEETAAPMLPKCKRHKVEMECDTDSECVWCTSIFGGGKCANATTSEWLPAPIYDCK